MIFFYFKLIVLAGLVIGCQKKEDEVLEYKKLVHEEEEDLLEWSSPLKVSLEEKWEGEEVVIFEKEFE